LGQELAQVIQLDVVLLVDLVHLRQGQRISSCCTSRCNISGTYKSLIAVGCIRKSYQNCLTGIVRVPLSIHFSHSWAYICLCCAPAVDIELGNVPILPADDALDADVFPLAHVPGSKKGRNVAQCSRQIGSGAILLLGLTLLSRNNNTLLHHLARYSTSTSKSETTRPVYIQLELDLAPVLFVLYERVRLRVRRVGWLNIPKILAFRFCTTPHAPGYERMLYKQGKCLSPYCKGPTNGNADKIFIETSHIPVWPALAVWRQSPNPGILRTLGSTCPCR
jgi:hypothetical protein